MEMKEKKYWIYLTNWQKRMIKDFLKIDCHVWEITIDDPTVKYGVRPSTNLRVKKMYLTDWQIRELRDVAGVCCDYIELDDGPHILYFVPTE